MKLSYEISADDRNLRRVLKGVEGEAKASSRRMARETGGRASDAHIRAREVELKRIEREERRAADRTAKYWGDAHRKAADHRIREGQRAERAVEREQRRAARVANRERAERISSIRGRVGGALGAAGGALGTVARMGGAAIGLAGGFAAAGALDEQIQVRRKASQLANQAGKPGLKGTLAEEARGVRGFTGMEALGGMEAFVTKTGNLDAARQALGPLAQLSLATGASLEDLGQTAGQVFNVLKGQISDPVQLMAELQTVMGTLAQQGSLGAVEIRDLAQEFGKLGAASRGFEGGAPALLRSMGAFAQIATEKGGASSSADAATAVGRLATDIVTKKDKFAALGVGIQSKTDKTKLRAPEEIMLDVLSKTGGDIMKTSGLFGLESKKVFNGMAATFSEAEAKKKGSGRAAAKAEFERFAGAKSSAASIADRAESRLSDPDMQLQEATKAFNLAIGTQLLPVVTQVIPKFTQLVPTIARAVESLAKFAGFVMENPFQGIGAVVGAKIAADIGGSMLKESIEKSLTTALATSGGLKVGGSIAIAASMVLLAANEYSKLSTQTEGIGGIMAGIGAMLNGESFAKGVSDFQDQKALGRFTDPFSEESKAARLAALKSEGTGVNANAPVKPLPAGAPTPFANALAATQTPGQSGTDGSFAQMLVAAKALQDAAGALVGAAGSGSSAKSPGAPARTGPINTRS